MEKRQTQLENNVGDVERVASLVVGGSLMAYGLLRRAKPGLGWAVLGGGLIYRGATGHCGAYRALGLNTARERRGQGEGRGASVPYQQGKRIDCSIRIERPRAEVYHFWRNLENLSRFMDKIENVRILDAKRSRWAVKGPAGMTVTWEAEINNEIEGDLIAWRSLPGSQVDSAGSVRFADAPGGATDLSISLEYIPPAGAIGKMAGRLLGEDLGEQIRRDLDKLKNLLETGSVSIATREENRGYRRETAAAGRDEVGKASEESFPASDAPSWTPETL